MPVKIFTLSGGLCPYGRGCNIESEKCRQCEHFYRTGTGTFFWCNHPDGRKKAENEPACADRPKRKRGRPPGPKKPQKPDIPKIGHKRAVNKSKPKNK